ncbi:MAG: alcohol dehydrogenase catalytic domain-containing protein [Planctomycetota bacterium]
MRAVVRRNGELYLDADAPDPAPDAGDAVIRPTRLTIARSDIAVARGEIDHEGIVGHQFVGVVEAVHDHTDEPLIGKRVVGDPAIVPSNSEFARRGLGHHARARTIMGLHQADGCFAERFTIPERNLAIVPDNVPDDAAVLWKPIASALHAAQLVRLEHRNFVTVIGDGLSALFCARVMTELNKTVRLLGWTRDLSRIAEKWGVRYRPASEVGLRSDHDVVVDCVASKQSMETAFGMARPRGAVIVKREPTPLPVESPKPVEGPDITPVILKELELMGARDGRPAEALDWLAGTDIDLSLLISKRFPFDESIAALRAAGEEDVMRVLIDC